MEENATPKNTTTSQTDEETDIDRLQRQLADFERVKSSLENVLRQVEKFEDLLLKQGSSK